MENFIPSSFSFLFLFLLLVLFIFNMFIIPNLCDRAFNILKNKTYEDKGSRIRIYGNNLLYCN